MKIPFSPPYIDQDVENEVLDALRSGWITTGPKVKALEQAICNYTNAPQALGVNSATSGMLLVLHWFGVTRGDEVIIPAYTYCATALVVKHLGAKPVMVDVQGDFNIDVNKIKAAITPKTKVIIPVDFAGWPADYDAINELVNNPTVKAQFQPNGEVQQKLGRILVMSDAAHSFGAIYKGRPAGTLADITVFSFHAVKNLTTAEGGAIVMNLPLPFDNASIYATMRLWSLNGQTKDAFTKTQGGGWKYDIVYPGFKMNLPDVCAAIGLAQIRKYDLLLNERKRVYEAYNTFFLKQAWAIVPPFQLPNTSSSYHIYPLRIQNCSEEQREQIIQLITDASIAVNVHFIPLPLLSIFSEQYSIQHFPQAFHQFQSEISLPIYPQLNNNQIQYIVSTVEKAVTQVLNA